jgi:hypothetical protein
MKLFDEFGDVKAKEYITACLTLVGKIADRYGGKVIKTIGDAIMYRFAEVDNAVNATCEIQNTLEIINNTPTEPKLSVRVGLHYGSVIIDGKGDIFGDAVNVASRVSDIAKAKQIMVTEQIVQRLQNIPSEMYRQFDQTTVKGKREALNIYEVLWTPSDVTRYLPPKSINLASHLTLQYYNDQRKIIRESEDFLLGRAEGRCDLVVGKSWASRCHATIRYRHGKFVLIDHSFNGTWVKTQDDRIYALRREEFPLWGQGIISLGKPIDPNEVEHLIFFSCS